jgi:hypothetical protein
MNLPRLWTRSRDLTSDRAIRREMENAFRAFDQNLSSPDIGAGAPPINVAETKDAFISPTKAETVDAPTVGNYRNGPHAHLVKVTSQNGAFREKWYAVGISRIRYAEAAVCALPEINPTDVVAALRRLTPVEVAAIGVGHRQIVLWTNGKGVHRPDTDTS